MVTRKSFERPFEGASSAYSKFMLIGTTLDKVVDAINSGDIHFTNHRSAGQHEEDFLDAKETTAPDGTKVVTFMIFSETPTILSDFTYVLKCRGYADTAWDTYYTEASENGKAYDGYKAEGVREEREEGVVRNWDFSVLDPEGNILCEDFDYETEQDAYDAAMEYVNGNNISDYDLDVSQPDYDPCECFDMFVTITDPSGATFETGAGAVDEDVVEFYEEMVRTH